MEKQSEIVKELNTYVENKFFDILHHPEKYPDINIIQENLGFSTWEDVFPNIMRWYLTDTGKTIDEEVSNLLISKRYVLLWFEEIHNFPQQYFPVYYYNFILKRMPSKADLEFMKNSLQGTLDRLQKNEESTFHNFSQCPCKTFHILLDMYRSFSDLLKFSIDQYNALIRNT